VLVLLAGCASDEGPHAGRGRRGPDSTAAATRAAPLPDMEAHAVFFAGKIEAEVLLGRSAFVPRSDGPTSGDRSRPGRGSGGFTAGMGGGGPRGGGGGGRGGGGEMPRSRPEGEGASRPNVQVSNAPPVQFRLRLTNHGSEAVVLEVPDFNSALGNFVVQPRSLTVPAGGSVEATPMTSRLAVGGTEVTLTLGLRMAGQTERHVLTLQPRAPAAATAPSPPPPSTP
jgi:hypothetical protein